MGGGGETITHTQEALTQNFTLPVPVGFSPQDIVIGATNLVTINDAAFVDTLAPVLTTQWGNIAAFGPTFSFTNIGQSAQVGVVWSRPSVFLRGGTIEFYKTTGSISTHPGFVYRQPEENRLGVTLRVDPIWTVSIIAPDTGTDINVNSNDPPRTLVNGNYGRVNVNGGTLILSGTNYGFVELNLNSGSTVQLTASTAPRIFVRNNLIIRSGLVKPGLILGYLGSNTVPIESGGFRGDLFLAPNASVDIKAICIGHFFARNVTVFEQVNVRGSVLAQSTLDFIRPTDVVGTTRGLFSTVGAQEISSAVLTPALNSACSADRAFVGYHGASMMHKAVSAIGTTTAATFPIFDPAMPPPSSCLGTWFPPITPAWAIPPSGGNPHYSDDGVGTDNLVTRMSGGRVVHAGFTQRRCTDASAANPQPSGCPMAQPTNGAMCDPDPLDNQACIYGTTQCQCRALCNDSALFGSGLEGASCYNDTNCCSNSCTLAPNPNPVFNSCTRPSPMPPTSWACGALARLEAGAIGVRMSTDCGGNWTEGAFDPSALGVLTGAGELVRNVDRPEMFWDNFDERLYLNGIMHRDLNGPSPLNLVFSASSAGVTSASNFVWQRVLPQVITGDENVLRVMTTGLDERARLTANPETIGRYVHLLTARCIAGRPEVQIYTPFGRRTWNLAEGDTDPLTVCQQVALGTNGQPFGALQFGPTIAAVSSTPPRLRIAYTGVADPGTSTERTIINVYSITIRSASSYSVRPAIVRELRIDASTSVRHSVFPQLLGADGLAGSDRLVDSPMVLRWSETGGDQVFEKARVLYLSGIAGPERTIATWRVSDVYGTGCGTGMPPRACFNGDYKYGAFYQKASGTGTLGFFTPWTSGGIDPATGMPVPNPTANGAFVFVTP